MPENALVSPLIAWFDTAERPLAWREPGTSAWAVLLSEVMSQQTPVARVEPQWRAWLERWPGPAELAAASTAEVITQWGTLGYPRRALRLKACAQAIVEHHGGQVPADVDALLALPGIGEYTARAVACFHFGQNVPVVDTNVRRVLHRAVHGRFLTPPARRSDLKEVAQLLPPAPRGPRFSVALMELGALVCTAKKPRCAACPLAATCAWVAAGQPQPSEEELGAARKRVQKFEGTDRQCRGRIMAALRRADRPVPRESIDRLWPHQAQLAQCLRSLVEDGLAEQVDPAGAADVEAYALPA